MALTIFLAAKLHRCGLDNRPGYFVPTAGTHRTPLICTAAPGGTAVMRNLSANAGSARRGQTSSGTYERSRVDSVLVHNLKIAAVKYNFQLSNQQIIGLG
jgi:hypothetical protein